MELSYSIDEALNRNGCFCHSFGSNSSVFVLRHKHFKCFFACVYPIILTPDQNKHTNWKVYLFLEHMKKIQGWCIPWYPYVLRLVYVWLPEKCTSTSNRLPTRRKVMGSWVIAFSVKFTLMHSFFHHLDSDKIIKTLKFFPLHVRLIGIITQLPNNNYKLVM